MDVKVPRFQFRHIKKIPYQAIDWVGSSWSLVIHTLLFAACFVLGFFGFSWDRILLVVTTAVSLEAIYLAIFIQMSVNRTTHSLQEVEENIDEIQEDVKDLGEDVVELAEDVQEIQEDDKQDDVQDEKARAMLNNIEAQLQSLIREIENLRKR